MPLNTVSHHHTPGPGTPEPSVPLLQQPTGGEDWLEVWVWLAWCEGTTWPVFRTCNQMARETGKAVFRNLGGHRIQFRPNPTSVHKGPNGRPLEYNLQVSGVDVALTLAKHGKHWPTAVVRINPRACLKLGAAACWVTIRSLFKWLGASIVKTALMRVGLCLDLPGQNIAPFLSAVRERRFVSKAKRRGGFEGAGGVSIHFGRRPLQARIYDKRAEIRRKAELRYLMVQQRWGGQVPEAATRIEFALERDALKRRGIGTVKEYFERRADLVDYLTGSWLRLFETVPSKGNEHKAKALVLWSEVRTAFAKWAGAPTGNPLKPLAPYQSDPKHLVRQIHGLVVAHAAMCGKKLKSNGDECKYVFQLLKKHPLEPHELAQKLVAKYEQFAAHASTYHATGQETEDSAKLAPIQKTSFMKGKAFPPPKHSVAEVKVPKLLEGYSEP